MSELEFTVLDIAPQPYAASPQLTARLEIAERTDEVVHAMVLACQVRIDPQRRAYSAAEERGLLDLFGSRDRWPTTLKPFLWMQTGTTVQGFSGSIEVDLPMPCTYDFDVAGAKYLHALREGTLALSLLFSGTVFTRGATGFGVEQVPWDRETTYRLPVSVWRDAMDHFFPNSGWIRLDRDAFDQLAHYRSERGLTSWEDTIRDAVAGRSEVIP